MCNLRCGATDHFNLVLFKFTLRATFFQANERQATSQTGLLDN